MIKMYQYRLYPNHKQRRLLEAVLDECRWLYNDTLEYRKTLWEKEQHSVSLYETINRLPVLKQQQPGLQSVHAQVLQQVCGRVDLAFQAFFRRVQTGEKPGFPRFKGKGRYDSFTFPQSGFKIKDKQLYLSKIGAVKIILHRRMAGKIKTLTIRRSSTGKWYACFSVGYEPRPLPEEKTQVGLDMGLHSFATLSTGEKIDNPRFFREEEHALATAQRKLSKALKGTPQRAERRKVVARVHERISWRRDNFTHQLARTLVKCFQVIAVEDLNVNRMLHNHCLAKSIADAAWSGFFSKLRYKAEDAGRAFVAVNPAYTSQTCSQCGHRQALTLADRQFTCSWCGFSSDRDHNAALNILAVGLHCLGNQPVEAPRL